MFFKVILILISSVIIAHSLDDGHSEFLTGMRSLFDLQMFIDSNFNVLREHVYEPTDGIEEDLVMGASNSSFTVLECFKEFEKNRDQQILMLSFSTTHILNRTLNEVLYKMDRPWVYIHVLVFDGPPPTQKTDFTTEIVLNFIRDFPPHVRWVLGYKQDLRVFMEDQHVENNTGYGEEHLLPVKRMLETFPEVRRSVQAIEMDVMHTSHSVYLLHNRVLPPTQQVLLKAPYNLLPNSTKVNFEQLYKIMNRLGKERIRYDMAESLKLRLLNDTVHVDKMAGAASYFLDRVLVFGLLLLFVILNVLELTRK